MTPIYNSKMKCLNCNNQTNNPKFCSSSCAASKNNTLFPKKSKSINFITCVFCKTDVVSRSRSKKKKQIYCNRSCRDKHEFECVTLPRFFEGLINFSGTLKSILIKLNGEVCAECNQSSIFRGKRLVLQLDHIDGDNKNNLPSNLRLLCPNCHSQTETYSRHIKSRNSR